MVLDALTLRRRLLTVLLLSAALTLMAQFSFRVGLCATGFSRFCSFSEQFHYCMFSIEIQSLTCSKNGFNGHAPFEVGVCLVEADADGVENVAARLSEGITDLRDRAGEFEFGQRIGDDGN